MNKFVKLFSFAFILSLILVLGSTSCKKDEKIGLATEDSIYFVTNEIMNSWYFWYDKVEQTDLYQYEEPQELLDDLKYAELDKWSFVELQEIIDARFVAGESFSIGFNLRWDAQYNLRIIYVHSKSDAANHNLKKGNIVKSIDGVSVRDIRDFSNIQNGSAGTFTFVIEDNFGVTNSYEITKKEFVQDGVMYSNIYTVAGKNTAYLVYDSFLGYSETELNEAFTNFSVNNIEELIIDLRYNTGGYISLAEQMINMIVPKNKIGETAYTYSHNQNVSMEYDTTITLEGHALNLDLERVFFITTEFSASASELVINTLEPHMDVFVIGSPSHGKPVGMYGFPFREYYIYPVTMKLINADGYGDFFEGLPVDYLVEEGLSYDWGDETEPNLHQAFHYISFGEFDDSPGTAIKSAPGSTIIGTFEKQPLLIINPQ